MPPSPRSIINFPQLEEISLWRLFHPQNVPVSLRRSTVSPFLEPTFLHTYLPFSRVVVLTFHHLTRPPGSDTGVPHTLQFWRFSLCARVFALLSYRPSECFPKSYCCCCCGLHVLLAGWLGSRVGLGSVRAALLRGCGLYLTAISRQRPSTSVTSCGRSKNNC